MIISEAIQLDRMSYDDIYQLQAETCYDYFEKNSDIYIMALEEKSDHVIGYTNFSPIKESVYKELIFGNTIDTVYHATMGGGAFLNDNSISVNEVPLEKAVLSLGDFPHSRSNDIIDEQKLLVDIYPKIARIRMFGASSIDFACVASGKTNGTILYTRNKWDIAPGILLCREAGAFVYGDNGEYSFDSRFVIAVSSKEILDCITCAITKQ